MTEATQDRLADRLALHAEQEAIEEKSNAGIIPHGVADVMLEEMALELKALRAHTPRADRLSFELTRAPGKTRHALC